ncbi:hypothetical protein BD780_001537 [Clostridium tetanomorphum]|uniref:Uncharacterized protein n=1 Tax=Clostridium tetanomorphum TaxID=1553 RepID=A0A923IZN2_CLOTT|nr:hypothetical protein [Clostridium tetanomorphum]KAJ52611.1 hypothetical protein CTM_06486 [Clostridium tetanomorphum DSM 665]MBC2396834.1 hypothetical protein [Clostridium tetanomorphum]MBP1863204.1 hypothetical protein [Clostridium tetanomorphum]NRS84312.1 hypothetical protein [Clostridium tetanomorphum]NRZ97526.1 hypothetical protein [Clostridium tetanomorphum]
MAFGWKEPKEDFDKIGINYIEVEEEQGERNVNTIFKGIREKGIIDKTDDKKHINKQNNNSLTKILKITAKVIMGIILYLIAFGEFTRATGAVTLIGGLATVYYLYFKNKKFKAKNIWIKTLVGILLAIFIFVFGICAMTYDDYEEYDEFENYQLENIQSGENKKNEIYTKIEKEKLYINTIIYNYNSKII